ncbi:GNAT family N-acetyltransferase [Mucilaginibacter kameinonensis]|uniref:GNAT family N-acetyltransferase n=1 Tax=Mucilaginibacter kameinonensis TaxID=452286 RepID=UPI0013CE8469|nr:GNAT family N-acetyltransferase [Mucilaginibacter kameinonensis]
MIPLTRAQLLLLKQDRKLLELSLGLNPSAMLIDPLYIKEIDDAFDNFWLPNTLAFPDKHHWYTDWEIVLKSTNTVIGGMGFAGYPNETGEAEIGYMIDANQHNNGFATEALKLLSQWAFTHDFVQAIIVHTYADNFPSRRILDKCGFSLINDVEGLLTYQLKK